MNNQHVKHEYKYIMSTQNNKSRVSYGLTHNSISISFRSMKIPKKKKNLRFKKIQR